MTQELEAHPLAGLFNRLTPDQVMGAIEVEGRRCTGRFFSLNSYENRVYQLELEDGSTIVGKFYRPGRWSRETILEEHAFLAELRELEIPVISPLELAPGQTIGEVQGILYALFPRVGGRAPQELSTEQVEVLGRLIARIHNVGASRGARARPQLSPETYGRQNLAYLVANRTLPGQTESGYAASVEALLQRIEPLFRDVPVHRIHGDCHPGNLLWTPSGPVFLDFDDLCTGPAVQDVWMLIPSADEEGQRQRMLLLESYRQFREFETGWLRLVEPLRALRYINYATWIARRWHDPTFRSTFAHFGTVQYWEGQIQDLREQIARVDQILNAYN